MMVYVVRLTLRYPDELHARVQEAARRDRRNVNAELIVLIERALDRADQEGADT